MSIYMGLSKKDEGMLKLYCSVRVDKGLFILKIMTKINPNEMLTSMRSIKREFSGLQIINDQTNNNVVQSTKMSGNNEENATLDKRSKVSVAGVMISYV